MPCKHSVAVSGVREMIHVLFPAAASTSLPDIGIRIELSTDQPFLPFWHNPVLEYSFCSILFMHPLSPLQYQQPELQTVM